MTQATDPLPTNNPRTETRPTQVVLYGLDASLLSYRNQVLRLAGFNTSVVELPLNDQGFSPGLQVGILCQSLTPEERRAAALRPTTGVQGVS